MKVKDNSIMHLYVTHLGGMIMYMHQVKELLLKNRLHISTYLTRVEHTVFTLYVKSSDLSQSQGINEG